MTFKTLSHSTENDNVVDMQRFRRTVELSPIRQAEAYWTALREDNGIPRRTAIDPRGLENILEYAFILERIASGIARFRLAGQHLTRLAGMEVRGMPLSAFFAPKDRQNIASVLEQVFDDPAISELTLTSEPRFGQSAADGHMLLLPLKSDMGDISRILGVLVSGADGGHGPVRFALSSSSFRPVAGLTYIDTDIESAVTAKGEPSRQAPTGRSHLRLIKVDRQSTSVE